MKHRVLVIVASVFVSLLVLVITLLSTVAVHNMFLAAPFDSIARISVASMMFVLGALSLTGLWYLFEKPFDFIAQISVASMMFVLGALSLTGLWYLFEKP